MSFRKATLNDLETVNYFFNQMRMPLMKREDFCQSYRIIYLEEIENHIISFICFLILSGTIELEAIYVRPEFRGNHCALNLLNKMFDEGKNLGCQQIFLDVRESNQLARSLYLKTGFIEIGCRHNYYGNEAGIVMKKELR